MDKRSEPRFQVKSAVKIAAIDQPAHVSEALLVDVSGAGLKLMAENWWPVDTRLVVEMENHLLVAQVRNVVPRGPQFSLGAEKLYSVLKHTLPAGVSRAVWHNLLIAEMRGSQHEVPIPAPPIAVAEPTPAVEFQEKAVEFQEKTVESEETKVHEVQAEHAPALEATAPEVVAQEGTAQEGTAQEATAIQEVPEQEATTYEVTAPAANVSPSLAAPSVLAPLIETAPADNRAAAIPFVPAAALLSDEHTAADPITPVLNGFQLPTESLLLTAEATDAPTQIAEAVPSIEESEEIPAPSEAIIEAAAPAPNVETAGDSSMTESSTAEPTVETIAAISEPTIETESAPSTTDWTLQASDDEAAPDEPIVEAPAAPLSAGGPVDAHQDHLDFEPYEIGSHGYEIESERHEIEPDGYAIDSERHEIESDGYAIDSERHEIEPEPQETAEERVIAKPGELYSYTQLLLPAAADAITSYHITSNLGASDQITSDEIVSDQTSEEAIPAAVSSEFLHPTEIHTESPILATSDEATWSTVEELDSTESRAATLSPLAPSPITSNAVALNENSPRDSHAAAEISLFEAKPVEATPVEANALETRPVEAKQVETEAVETETVEAEMDTLPIFESAHSPSEFPDLELYEDTVINAAEPPVSYPSTPVSPTSMTDSPRVSEAPKPPAVPKRRAPVRATEEVAPVQASQAENAPPLASALPLAPRVASMNVSIASPPLQPQFGPAYGMAPTTDVLLPMSTMPEIGPGTPARPRWMIASAVAAGMLGLTALSFYYGPYRPQGPSAIPQATAHQVGTLTVPAVTEAPTAVAPDPQPAAQQQAVTHAAEAQAIKPVPVETAKSATPAAPSNTLPSTTPLAAKPVQPAQGNTAASAAPAPANPGGARRAIVKATGLEWVSACSDGKPAISKVLKAGETLDVGFQRITAIRVGNAAAAQLEIDGKPMGPMGTTGNLKIVEVNATGPHELPSTLAAGAECQPQRIAGK